MTDKNTYRLPEDNSSQMVEENVVSASQYAEDLRSGVEMLKCVSPEELHNIVIYLSDITQQKYNSTDNRTKFEKLFEEWWQKTCMYSGSGLCFTNTCYTKLRAMGPAIMPYIIEKEQTAPDYMKRHIGWLKRDIKRWQH